MRSDYMLYTVAIIFFVITGISFAVLNVGFERNLSVVSTAILGLLFLALGFALRPKPAAVPTSVTSTYSAQSLPPPPPEPEPARTITQEPVPVTETVAPARTEAITEAVSEAVPRKLRLTRLKGIGETRAKQLNGLSIRNIEDLTKASVTDLAEKLDISPKITERWIASAKELLEKS
jgi:predicted flap endonuclease-1-like 5' DNA nuclease